MMDRPIDWLYGVGSRKGGSRTDRRGRTGPRSPIGGATSTLETRTPAPGDGVAMTDQDKANTFGAKLLKDASCCNYDEQAPKGSIQACVCKQYCPRCGGEILPLACPLPHYPQCPTYPHHWPPYQPWITTSQVYW